MNNQQSLATQVYLSSSNDSTYFNVLIFAVILRIMVIFCRWQATQEAAVHRQEEIIAARELPQQEEEDTEARGVFV